MFSKALPCLSAIGGALSPDYSYLVSSKEKSFNQKEEEVEEQQVDHSVKLRTPFEPIIIDTISYVYFVIKIYF